MSFAFIDIFIFIYIYIQVSEVFEAVGDFDSIRQYLRGSGNKLDCVIMSLVGNDLFYIMIYSI